MEAGYREKCHEFVEAENLQGAPCFQYSDWICRRIKAG